MFARTDFVSARSSHWAAFMIGQAAQMHSKISPDHLDYVRRREVQERAAAKQASSLGARRAHQELAQLYAQLASQ